MTEQEIKKVFKNNDISLTELKVLYNKTVRDAEKLWKEDCIYENSSLGLPKLYAQIGFNKRRGLMQRTGWQYSYMTGDSEEWYYALKISVLDGDADNSAIDASDWLYEDNYYKRTGNISQKALLEASKSFPLEFLTFDEVAETLAEMLQSDYD